MYKPTSNLYGLKTSLALQAFISKYQNGETNNPSATTCPQHCVLPCFMTVSAQRHRSVTYANGTHNIDIACVIQMSDETNVAACHHKTHFMQPQHWMICQTLAQTCAALADNSVFTVMQCTRPSPDWPLHPLYSSITKTSSQSRFAQAPSKMNCWEHEMFARQVSPLNKRNIIKAGTITGKLRKTKHGR